ncbi:MAG TPA: hypothetical protein VKE22_27920 [Haliangiales bacterium]|nr:hypothetical protein [Haliangiales bacterium]
MTDQTKFTQVQQQIASEWEKLVTGQVAAFETVLAEIGKLQAKGIAQAIANFEEAGRYAKESLALVERVSGEWRKLAIETAQRAAHFITP